LAEQLTFDYRAAELTSGQRALCDFAVKLTLTPGAMSGRDTDSLRRAGWSDEQIHLATQVIGYFNYINRMADGLGVDDEAWMKPPKSDWLARKGNDYLGRNSEASPSPLDAPSHKR
jgi:uncharacterized protein YciW